MCNDFDLLGKLHTAPLTSFIIRLIVAALPGAFLFHLALYFVSFGPLPGSLFCKSGSIWGHPIFHSNTIWCVYGHVQEGL